MRSIFLSAASKFFTAVTAAVVVAGLVAGLVAALVRSSRSASSAAVSDTTPAPLAIGTTEVTGRGGPAWRAAAQLLRRAARRKLYIVVTAAVVVAGLVAGLVAALVPSPPAAPLAAASDTAPAPAAASITGAGTPDAQGAVKVKAAQTPAAKQGAAKQGAAKQAAKTAKAYSMYDSVTPSKIPSGRPVATYATGNYAVSPSKVSRPGVTWIDTDGTDPQHASVLDVEPGNVSPAFAATWVKKRLTAHPTYTARVYTMLSEWSATKAAIATLPAWMQSHVRYWIADPTGVPHVVPGSTATQWYWGSNYDISTVNPGF